MRSSSPRQNRVAASGRVLVGQTGAVAADDKVDHVGGPRRCETDRRIVARVAQRVVDRDVEQLFGVVASDLDSEPGILSR